MAHLTLIKSGKHAEAIKRRDAFLMKHPELIPFQNQIDERMRKAGTKHNRLVVIHDLMMESFRLLHEKLMLLRKAYN